MQINVIHEQGRLCQYDEEQFKHAMGVDFLSHLEFASDRDLETIKKKIAKSCLRREITIRQKWLGTYYSKEILNGSSPDLFIQWMSPEIGYGVIAGQNIQKHAFIGEYTGIVRKRPFFGNRKNCYSFVYAMREGREGSYIIDAQPKGNYTRYINHGDRPNLEPVSVLCDGLLHIILIAIQPIPKGTQLTYDYGDDYWEKRQHIKRSL